MILKAKDLKVNINIQQFKDIQQSEKVREKALLLTTQNRPHSLCSPLGATIRRNTKNTGLCLKQSKLRNTQRTEDAQTLFFFQF